jgi:hypothetical protein
LSTTLSLGSALHQREHVVHGALAIAAVVIEELDEGDVTLRVAGHDLARGIENRLGVVLDRGLVLRGFIGGLLLLQLGHRVLQHFGMRDQILADDLFDLAALRVRDGLRVAGECAKRQDDAGRESQTCQEAH